VWRYEQRRKGATGSDKLTGRKDERREREREREREDRVTKEILLYITQNCTTAYIVTFNACRHGRLPP